MKKRLEEIRKQAAELLAEARLLERVEEDWTTWNGLLDDPAPISANIQFRRGTGTDDDQIHVLVKIYHDIPFQGQDAFLECHFTADKGAFVFWEQGGPLDVETIEKELQRGEEE